ncbi:MAG TPA: DUF4928 family protein [Pirellulaceae bacterium]|nr:DUF4928 family protein [Pirellulaceae bacterium]
MSATESAVAAIQDWHGNLPTGENALPSRGAIAAALVVLEKLKTEYSLAVGDFLAKGGAQIAGLTRQSLDAILRRHGENRTLIKEGGRTNRGNPRVVADLLEALTPLGLDVASDDERRSALDACQVWLVGQVGAYFACKPLTFAYDPAKTTFANLSSLVAAARDVGKLPSLAQYLVGAKLQLRFPDREISNDLASSPDAQSGRVGDFQLGDTVFHVTASPKLPVIEKCGENLTCGLKAYLIVPNSELPKVAALADVVLSDRITVCSLESFVAANLEELAEFQTDARLDSFRRLLETYNRRVDAVETDKSMLVEIPRPLQLT